MNNPFSEPLTPEYLMAGWGFDHEEAEYLAHAIDQHDKLMDYVRNNCHPNRDGTGWMCGSCKIIGPRRCWQNDCARAALLKEEKP